MPDVLFWRLFLPAICGGWKWEACLPLPVLGRLPLTNGGVEVPGIVHHCHFCVMPVHHYWGPSCALLEGCLPVLVSCMILF
jgi:hypothetical protein